jgi:hypothetical protein
MRVRLRLWRQLWSWFKSVNRVHYGADARRGNRRRSGLHGYSQLQRAFAFQTLEPRQLLASDIALTDFAANGRNLLVSYDIAAETAPAFNVSVYRSSDGVTRDSLIGSREIALETERTVGSHTIEIAADFVDVREDYRLIAVADPANGLAETNEENNQLSFASGAFRSADDVLHVHGTDAADSVRIDVAEPANGSGSARNSIAVQINDATM